MQTIIHGDCLDEMQGLAPESISLILTDPPYGLSFMGKDWDHGVPGKHFWELALAVARPGAHLMAFGGTRTFHRLACAIEDAGWEIRDCIGWLYGSGFPKSLDISKAIDKAAGAERKVVAEGKPVKRMIPGADQFKSGWKKDNGREFVPTETEAATAEAREWDGWGTGLKPSWEPIIVARKPFEGTVIQNVLKYGTGALNIELSRIKGRNGENLGGGAISSKSEGWNRPWKSDDVQVAAAIERSRESVAKAESLGRWPANLIHDGSDEVVEIFPAEAGAFAPVTGSEPSAPDKNVYGKFERGGGAFHFDSGSASRFFYCAKPTPSERGSMNSHPTVKPLALMRYLIGLAMPPGGVLLDPFVGSGSTMIAAKQLGVEAIGIGVEAEYCDIARRRLAEFTPNMFEEESCPTQ